mmetsp:Transcript_30799/g.30302  ORF Transcript_30799/g.30302 Transcript_30799/m.30302 type:complete len:280 (+) Transcript_30799:310-1149(+)
MFSNIKGLGNYKDEFLDQQVYYVVLNSIDFKIEQNDLYDVLDTFTKDADNRVSYVHFCNEFKRLYETKSDRGGLQGIKYFDTPQEALQHMAEQVSMKGLSKVFGEYLAGCDLHDSGKIERSAFYRVIQSMGFGLGEGDIQALIRVYDQLNTNEIPLRNFVDDLNRYIMNGMHHIQLKSNVNKTVNQRIVDPVTPPPQRHQLSEKNFQANIYNLRIIKDFFCGFYVQGRTLNDLEQWLHGFSQQSKSQLNQNEFVSVLDAVQVKANYGDKQTFFDNLFAK